MKPEALANVETKRRQTGTSESSTPRKEADAALLQAKGSYCYMPKGTTVFFPLPILFFPTFPRQLIKRSLIMKNHGDDNDDDSDNDTLMIL